MNGEILLYVGLLYGWLYCYNGDTYLISGRISIHDKQRLKGTELWFWCTIAVLTIPKAAHSLAINCPLWYGLGACPFYVRCNPLMNGTMVRPNDVRFKIGLKGKLDWGRWNEFHASAHQYPLNSNSFTTSIVIKGFLPMVFTLRLPTVKAFIFEGEEE